MDSVADTSGNLSARAASGMVWLAGQTVFSRIISFATNMVLAWILAPEHFGQIGLVYTITSFATQLINPGIDDVLLQKQRHLRRWVTPAFWMSVSFGLIGAVVMVLAGVVVVAIARAFGNAAYGNSHLVWMIVILAAGAPLNAAALVPSVILRSQMRFARLAGINLGEVVGQQLLTVVLALLGCGAYSFVIPMPIIAAIRGLVLWYTARPPVHARLGMHRWPSLTSATGWVFGQRLLATASMHGDRMVLGVLFADDGMVGVYYFAFILCTQVMRVLCDNIAAVLMPALNAIHDDVLRTQQAAERASRALAAVIIPVLAAQILLAGPGIRLLFEPKWEPSIPLVQWLSLGPLLYSASWPMGAMISASGRFRAGFFLWVFNVLSFFALVIPGAWIGRDVGAAIGVSVWSWVTGLAYGVCAYRSLRGAWIMLEVVARPIAAAGVGAACCWPILWNMPSETAGDLLSFVVVGAILPTVYYLLLRLLDAQAIQLLSDYMLLAFRPLARLLRRSEAPVG